MQAEAGLHPNIWSDQWENTRGLSVEIHIGFFLLEIRFGLPSKKNFLWQALFPAGFAVFLGQQVLNGFRGCCCLCPEDAFGSEPVPDLIHGLVQEVLLCTFRIGKKGQAVLFGPEVRHACADEPHRLDQALRSKQGTGGIEDVAGPMCRLVQGYGFGQHCKIIELQLEGNARALFVSGAKFPAHAFSLDQQPSFENFRVQGVLEERIFCTAGL